eukprot:3905637-Ditylum_brightwellii.AAC.1
MESNTLLALQLDLTGHPYQQKQENSCAFLSDSVAVAYKNYLTCNMLSALAECGMTCHHSLIQQMTMATMYLDD